MRTPHFRAMTPVDLEVVLRIERGCFESPWERHVFAENMQRSRTACYVAVDGGRVVAYAALALDRDGADLLNFAVDPERRRTAVGRALMEFLFDVCRMRELPRIRVELRESNLDGQLFCRSLGFLATRVLRGHFADTGEDAYLMQRTVETAAPQVDE